MHTGATLGACVRACVRAMRPAEENGFQGQGGAESTCGCVMQSKVENGLANRN